MKVVYKHVELSEFYPEMYIAAASDDSRDFCVVGITKCDEHELYVFAFDECGNVADLEDDSRFMQMIDENESNGWSCGSFDSVDELAEEFLKEIHYRVDSSEFFAFVCVLREYHLANPSADVDQAYQPVEVHRHGSSENVRKNIKAEYERIKLQWMINHHYTLTNLMDELETLRQDSEPDTSIPELFCEWECDRGFGSEIWPCFDEYCDCEL